ncbi:MAG: HEAT repeat domain-containing protein [Anaerolineae bacterium]|nr:HEAT repeat domain-containing protein [Anaerolineae bacterium]
MGDWLKNVLDKMYREELQITDLRDDFKYWLYTCELVEAAWEEEGFQERNIQEGYLSLRVSIGLLYLIRKVLNQHRSSASILGGLLLILARYVCLTWHDGTRPTMEEAVQNLVDTEWLQQVIDDAEMVEVVRQQIQYPISRTQAYMWIEKGREVLQEAIDTEVRASAKEQSKKQRLRAAGYYRKLLEMAYQRIHVAGLGYRLLKDVFVAMPLRRVKFDKEGGWKGEGYFVPEDLWEQQRVVLEGPSGGGKTTLLHYLAWQWARDGYGESWVEAVEEDEGRNRRPVPLVIADVSSYLALSGEVEPLEYALQELLRGTETSVGERIELRRYLMGEKKIYLLDGGDQAVERRGELHRLLERLPRWVLAMRDAVRVGRYLAGMQVVRLEPWTESQLRTYLSRLCRGEGEVEERVHTVRLLEARGELTRWPLWVTLIGTDKGQVIHLPDLVARGLGRWFERGEEFSAKQDEILKILRKLSWASYVSPSGDRGWLWEGWSSRERWALRQATKIGLLRLSDQGRYRFVHEVFRAYLAARAMIERADIAEAVRELVGRPGWQEVMYWAGQLLAEEDSSRLEAWGQALVTVLDDTLLTSGWLEAASLIGQMYHVAPGMWREWRKQAVERVWEWWRSSPPNPFDSRYELHEAAINALAALEAVEKIPSLQKCRWDGWWARSAIRTIGRIGGEEAFAVLQGIAEDMDAGQRSEYELEVVEAIGALRGGDEESIVAWLVQQLHNDGRDRRAVARVLGRRGGELSLRALLNLGRERGTTLSSFCRKMISEEWNGPPGAIVQALERAVADNDIDLIQVLAQAAQRLHIVEAVPLLMEVLRHRYPEDRLWAVKDAVWQLGGVEILETLKAWVWESEREQVEGLPAKEVIGAGRGLWARHVLSSVLSYLPVSELERIIFDEEEPDWLRWAAVCALSGKDRQAAVRTGRCIVEQKGEELSWGVYLLGRGHDTESLPRLRGLIAHADVGVREHAADAVAALGDEEAGPLLARQLLEEREQGARWNQIEALEKLGAREGVPVLAEVARQCVEDQSVQELALQALGRLGGAEAAAALLELWEERGLRFLEEDICQALADTGREEAVERLLAAARQGNEVAREALGMVHSQEALPVLLAGMEDKDPEVREACVRGLGRIEDERVLPGLLVAVTDEDQWVRTAADQGLNQRLQAGMEVERPEVCRSLEEALSSLDNEVREWAVICLSYAVPWNVSVKGRRRLQEMVRKDPDAKVRAAAARVLGALRVLEAHPVLWTAFLHDEDEAVRRAALAGLIQLNQAEDNNLLLSFAFGGTSLAQEALVGRLDRLCFLLSSGSKAWPFAVVLARRHGLWLWSDGDVTSRFGRLSCRETVRALTRPES